MSMILGLTPTPNFQLGDQLATIESRDSRSYVKVLVTSIATFVTHCCQEGRMMCDI